MRRKIAGFTAAAGLAGWLFLGAACRDDPEVPTEAQREANYAVLDGISQPLRAPVRLAVLPSGQLLVSDSDLRMIVAIDPATLQPESGFEVEGKPLGLGAKGGRIFVGNVSRRTVEYYDLKGRLRGSFGAGAVEFPTDLAVDEATGLVFVVDGGAREVRVFDQNGRPQGTISGPGTGNSFLQSPTGIAVNPTRGEVLVGDYGPDGGSASIKIFDYNGNYVDDISGAGRCGMLGCSGGFSRPQGLEVDGEDRIYVTDALLAEVLVFDRTTKARIAALGGRDVGLRLPLDVAVDKAGAFYVTSNRTGKVELLETGGVLP